MLENEENFSKEKLETLNSKIIYDENNRNKLITLFEKLGDENSDNFDLKKMQYENNGNNIDILIYNIKDFIIMLILLLSSVINYNYLNIPFILVTLFNKNSVLKLKEESRNKKLIIELILMVYSLVLLIFKIICMILISKNIAFFENYKSIFIDLGISYINNKEQKFYFFSTFLGEGLIFIFSIFAIIIEKVVDIDDEEIDNRYYYKLTYSRLFEIMRRYLLICFFVISGVGVFNKSILSLIYILSLGILLFLYSIDFDKIKLYKLIRIIIIILIYMVICQILLINISNIYSISNKCFTEEKKEANNNILIIWKQFGFYFGELNSTYINIFSYFFISLSFVTFNLCINAISLHELRIAKKDEENNCEKDFEKNNLINKFINIWSNPYFILHICRIMGIIWLFIYRNFYSLGIFIWLFFSFLYIHISTNDFWTKFILIPCICISFISIHITRINNVFNKSDEEIVNKKYFQFALGEYNYDYIRYIFIILFYFFVTDFLHVLNVFNKKIISSNSILTYKEHKENRNNNNNKLEENFKILEEKIKYNNDSLLFDKKENNYDILIKDKNNNNNFDEINLKNVISKFFFQNIDKLTLISIFIVISNTINIFHFIFVIIFILQLFFPELIKNISMILIQIFNIFYLVEYIFDLSKVYNYDSFKKNILKIKFVLPFDKELNKTSVEILIHLIVYCLYIQYQLNSHKEYYSLVNNDNINLVNLIHKKFKKKKKLKKIIFLLGNILSNIYIWILVILFIFILCYYEINLFLTIEFGIFLVSLYIHALNIQNKYNKYKKLGKKLGEILLFYSGIYALLLYFYQIVSHEFINFIDRVYLFNNFLLNNLPNIGFTKYPENILFQKLFPLFLTNFLSMLYLSEIQRNFKHENNNNNVKKIYINENDDELKKLQMEEQKEENKSKEEEESPAEKYQKNVQKITKLEITNFLFLMILILTRFYWLLIFIIICIFFTLNYLSFGMIIYMIIFGFIFIYIFHKTIPTLNKFSKKDSYFISKIIRYHLIEKKFHIEQNTKTRKIGFRILFAINCIYFFLFYLSGVFYLFENGCDEKYLKGCDSHHLSLFNENNEYIKNRIIALSYLFGFYVKIVNKGILSASWSNLILFCLIVFDVYIEKLENYFNGLSLKNRQKQKILLNENIKLKPFISLGKENFMANIKAKLSDNINNNINNENNNYEFLEKKYNNIIETINNKIKNKISDNDMKEGKKYLIQFLEAINKGTNSDEVKLSEVNNKDKIIKAVKSIYEEIIIFLLICTAISKLNIWSFIYMIFSLILILTKKSIVKYYILFCFIIVATIFQNIIFTTNIKYETDPGKSKDILNIIKNALSIPWYIKYTDDKNGFFFGLGVNRIQINLMWMDYIEIIIIYIYLEYFSYSIYQNYQKKKGWDKISYYNLYNNEKVLKAVKRLNLRQFKKYQKCMKINFNIDLGDFDSFKNKIFRILPKGINIELRPLRHKSIQINYNTEDINKNKTLSDIETINPSPLLKSLRDSKKLVKKSNLLSSKKEEYNCLDIFKRIIYLSFHNIILTSILLISMTISGLLSIFYIIYSLIFLSQSNSMYMGEPYYYPKTIKTILRVAILLDITIQMLYQTPYLSPGPEGSGLYTILEIIGFNKIIFFEENSAEKFEISLKEMILVFAKAFTYFFMSIQVLIYSSQDFQEFYLIYLLTKNNRIRKISLMNVFRFNNERIEEMLNSFNIRKEMINSMERLKNTLNNWNNKLFNLQNENSNEIVEYNENNTNKFVPENIVKEKIKKWIFESKLMVFQLWLHKNASSYLYIDKDERDIYKKEVIQGRTTITSMLESLVEKQLNTINLSEFTTGELKDVKKYFDGTKKNELKKLKDDNNENKNEEKEKDIVKTKFEELEKFTSNELFVKYLKTNYIIKCIIKDIFSSCIKHFHWLCYIIMLINHILNNSLLSLFYPFSIFLLALLEYPRPSKTYWNICLIYTVIIIGVKFSVQLELFVKIFENENEIDAEGKIINKYKSFIFNNFQKYKIGIVYYESTSSLSFFNYIIYDAIVIMILLINNYILISRGLWVKKENEIEDIYQAMERIALTKHLKLNNNEEVKSFNSLWLFDNKTKSQKNKINGIFHNSHISVLNLIKWNQDNKIYEYMEPNNLEYYKENKRNYFEKLFPKIRNEKPGHDFYIFYNMGMFLIIIFIIVYYTEMNMDRTYNPFSIDSNQFSDEMIIFLIIHISFLIFDRIIYLSQNRNNLKYDYILYNKNNNNNCEPISEQEFKEIKNSILLRYKNIKENNFFIPNEYIEEKKDIYNIIKIQIEEFNFPLFEKYILLILVTLFSHILIFFYLPMKGNYNIGRAIYCIEDEDCNDFLYNKKLIVFYCLYLIYLIFSALQIKYGFYDMKRKSLLKSENNSINSGIYSVFKAIPFLYEIKLAIDWAFTNTGLDLFQWNKFENIYDTIYITYCSMSSKNSQFIGKKIKLYLKMGIGCTISFVLILLVIIPIIIYSSLNPTNELNNLTGGKLKIDLAFYYNSSYFRNFTLFENSKPESIESLFQYGEEEWIQYKFSESIETKNFPKEQIQKIEFFTESERNWRMTKPFINNLIQTLDKLIKNNIHTINKVYLVMDYSFIRNWPVEARIVEKRLDKIIYDINDKDKYNKNETELVKKIKEIKDVLINCDNKTFVSFENIYSTPHHLTANIYPEIFFDENYNFTQGFTLGFSGCKKNSNNETTYLESFFTLKKITKERNNKNNSGIVFHIFSDKISSTISGYSVITFYVTFILLAGTYIRNFFSGQEEKIILTEMPNPEEIINLCEGILLARFSFDYEQEEELYYILIELMRSPDYLRILTNSSMEQFYKRRNLTYKEKNYK